MPPTATRHHQALAAAAVAVVVVAAVAAAAVAVLRETYYDPDEECDSIHTGGDSKAKCKCRCTWQCLPLGDGIKGDAFWQCRRSCRRGCNSQNLPTRQQAVRAWEREQK